MPSTREAALALCQPLTGALEGCRLTAYPDTGGKLTIGYGHTGGVRAGQEISDETAKYLLGQDLDVAADTLEKCVPSATLDRELDNHERAALYDFAFNLGDDPKWQINALLRAGNVNGARDQIPRFDHGIEGGKEVIIPGLEHRRTAEVIFFNTADQAAAVAVTQTPNAVPAPSSGYTRAIQTPPAPTPAPAGATTSLVAKCVTAAGGACVALGSTAGQIHGVISPYVDSAKVFQTLDTVAVGAIIVAGVAGVLIHVNQAQARAT
jgi:lysozyme